MHYKNFNADNWATPAHFKVRGKNEEHKTECAMPNEKRFFNCPAEKTLSKTRDVRYIGAERIAIVSNAANLFTIKSICEACIHNKANQRSK